MLPLDHRMEHNGQTVAWGRLGEGDPVVLVHGFPWSSQAWRRVAPWLARERSVYYFDMLGCGLSDKFEGQDVSPAVQNDLLAALIDHWGLERPHVVGHDFGGLAALRGHFVNGLRYGRLTLIDAVAVLPSGSPFFAHVREHEQAFAKLPGYAHDALFRAYIASAALHPLDEAAVALYAGPWQGEVGQAAFYRQIAHSDARYIAEIQSAYRPLDFRLDLVWGERDTFIPLRQGEELADLLAPETFTRVPDAGHAIQEDAPEALVGALLTA